MSSPIPIIDISPLRQNNNMNPSRLTKVVSELRSACTGIGFFTLVGHEIDPELIKKTRKAAAAFFSAPNEIKQNVIRPPEKITRGWNPPGDRALSNTLDNKNPPDLQEAWGMGPITSQNDAYHTAGPGKTFFAENQWPDIPGYQKTVSSFYKAMSNLADDLLRGFALALDIEPTYFVDKTNKHCSNVRFIFYPSQSRAPLNGQLRAGEHTDYGTFTFVRGDNVPGGLQVSDNSGGWYNVETPENGFVCNIGDTMQLWTGGRFKSTLHRVVNPPVVNRKEEGRISLVYFHQPNYDAALSGINTSDQGSKTLTFAEHYFGKIHKANAGGIVKSSATVAQLISGEVK